MLFTRWRRWECWREMKREVFWALTRVWTAKIKELDTVARPPRTGHILGCRPQGLLRHLRWWWAERIHHDQLGPVGDEKRQAKWIADSQLVPDDLQLNYGERRRKGHGGYHFRCEQIVLGLNPATVKNTKNVLTRTYSVNDLYSTLFEDKFETQITTSCDSFWSFSK